MLNLNPFAIAALFTALSSLWVAANFFIYGKKKIHYLWAAFNSAIFGWSLFVVLAVTTQNSEKAYMFWNYSHVFGTFISIIFFHTVSNLCNLNAKNLIRFSYVYGFLYCCIAFFLNGHPINIGVNFLFHSMYYLKVDPKSFIIFISFWIFLALYGNYKLLQSYSAPDKKQQTNVRFLFVAAVVGYLGGISSFLPALGFINFYPFSIIGVGICCLISTYAIFKHQFLELQVIYKKSLVYSFLIALITISYLSIVLIIEKIVKTSFGPTFSNTGLLPAFIVGILVIPLKNWLQDKVDRVFLKGTAVQIAEENVQLRQEVIKTEKLRAVATLASGLAHEIRNPLTTILTFTEHLPKKKDDPEFINKYQTILVNETHRVNELLTQLLAFAKPSPPALQEINLNNVIEEVLLLTDHQCSKHLIHVHKSLVNNQIVQADPNQLKQALLNIVLNAIDAMPKGGTLSITTSTENHFHVISIKDSGIGIDSKDLKQLFDPFFTKKDKGTGLGLAITHGIIEQHGGRIKVLSTLGIGCEFIINLKMHHRTSSEL